LKQHTEDLTHRYDKLSDDKIALLDTLRDLESDYRIVKEDLKALEEKYRESNQQLQLHIAAASGGEYGNSISQVARLNRITQQEV
jgi:predicted nuclease with TOPRIM domain